MTSIWMKRTSTYSITTTEAGSKKSLIDKNHIQYYSWTRNVQIISGNLEQTPSSIMIEINICVMIHSAI